MEDWMAYERVLRDLFQQPSAYDWPQGAASMGWLYQVSDAELRRLPRPRLEAQALSVDQVFEYWKGAYSELWHVAEKTGLTPYLDEHISQAARALRRIQEQQRRLRALLGEARAPGAKVVRLRDVRSALDEGGPDV
jgi:hypothetical protein